MTFRQTFDFGKISKEIYQWFPGHMAKGLKKIYEKLPEVDAVIQVHDARAPFTGRNSSFRNFIIGNKPFLFILNKADLADLTHKDKIIAKLEQESYSPCFFTSLKDTSDKTTKKILPNIIKQIENQFRFNREMSTTYNLLVIGVPNVGKSTLINRLRNYNLKEANAVRVGANPGITRSVQSKVKVNQNPLVYMYDTPGVLEPTFEDIETGFKLACLNCIKNHQVNADLLADYLLFKLNKSFNYKYVEYYKLDQPTDNITDLLLHVAKSKNITKKFSSYDGSIKRVYDIDHVAQMMIKHFFDGHLGKAMFDEADILKDDNEREKEQKDKHLELDRFV